MAELADRGLYQASNARLLFNAGPVALIRTTWERCSRSAPEFMERSLSIPVEWIGETTLQALRDWVVEVMATPGRGYNLNNGGQEMFDGCIGDIDAVFGAELVRPFLGEFQAGRIEVGRCDPWIKELMGRTTVVALRQGPKRLVLQSRTHHYRPEPGMPRLEIARVHVKRTSEE